MSDLFDPTKAIGVNPHIPIDEAKEGWRAWIVERQLPRYGNPPKLRSINGGKGFVNPETYYWTPRRTAHAECKKGCDKIDIPRLSCSCGFYSAKTFEQLLDELPYAYGNTEGFVRAIGRVANWGRVIEGSQGWRSSKSYPLELWVPHSAAHLLQPLKEAYGCPVGLRTIKQEND